MLNEKDRSKLFLIFEELKKEKEEANSVGITSASKKEVMIIDGYNTFIRCFCAVPTLNEDGLHTGGISGFLKSVGYALKLFKPDRCVIVFDGPGGSMKRRKIYPDYKAHKKTTVRLNRIYDFNTDLGDEQQSLKKQLQRTVAYLQLLPVNMLSLDNVEADDTMAHLALDYFKDWNVKIMSADKDFLQLVSDRVSIWSPTKKKLYTPQDVLTEYGIHPTNFVSYRALDGDTSDNIDGIKGCGLKTIIKSFPFLSNNQPTNLKQIYEYCESKAGTLKIYQTILSNWGTIERNYSLMQLTETQVTSFAQLHIKECLDNPIPKLNRFEFAKLITEDKLWNNIPNYQTWIGEVFTKLDNFIRD
jgi:5'-3' exonuclease